MEQQQSEISVDSFVSRIINPIGIAETIQISTTVAKSVSETLCKITEEPKYSSKVCTKVLY